MRKFVGEDAVAGEESVPAGEARAAFVYSSDTHRFLHFSTRTTDVTKGAAKWLTLSWIRLTRASSPVVRPVRFSVTTGA